MASPEQAEPTEPQLPMVVSPKLDGSDETDPFGAASEEAAAAPAGETAAALSRSVRFALLAGSVAAAAALGSFVGALSASGVMRLYSEPARHALVASAPQPATATAKAELAELGALKAGIDGASRNANGQFAKLADRIDRVERMQIEAATKAAHVADAVDRLEKKSVIAAAAAAPIAPETTGSIAAVPQSVPAVAKAEDKILPDWIVQDVRGGHALIENSRGGVFDVAAGTTLPALGRVQTIKRQDGQWVVITAGGVITEHNEVK